MNLKLARVREALLVHFIESPYSRLSDRVEVRVRGLSIYVDQDGPGDSLRVQYQGEFTSENLARLAKADDLLQGQISDALLDRDLAQRVLRAREEGEHHVLRGQFKGHHYDGVPEEMRERLR